jgi:hypothetical protein
MMVLAWSRMQQLKMITCQKMAIVYAVTDAIGRGGEGSFLF